jgi:hypothetical protein
MSSRLMCDLFVLQSFAPEIIAIHPGQSTATALRQCGFAERLIGLIRRQILNHVRRAAFRTHSFSCVISNNGCDLKVPQFSPLRFSPPPAVWIAWRCTSRMLIFMPFPVTMSPRF